MGEKTPLTLPITEPTPPIPLPPHDATSYVSPSHNSPIADDQATAEFRGGQGINSPLGDHFVRTAPPRTPLDIFNLNVMGAPSKWRRPQRFREIAAEFIKGSGADVVTLQETFPKGLARELFTHPFGRKYTAYQEESKPTPGKPPLFSSGLTTLLSDAVLEWKFFPFRKRTGWEIFANKGVLFTRVRRLDGSEIDVYNLHCQSSYQLKKDQKQFRTVRMEQLKDLIQWIADNSPPERTVLVIGDFNFVEGSEEYNAFMDTNSRLYQGMSDKDQFDFIDVMRTVDPTTPLHTFDWDKPHRSRRLDYLFLRLGTGWEWDPTQSQVELVDTHNSDHKAVSLSLALVPPYSPLPEESDSIAASGP